MSRPKKQLHHVCAIFAAEIDGAIFNAGPPSDALREHMEECQRCKEDYDASVVLSGYNRGQDGAFEEEAAAVYRQAQATIAEEARKQNRRMDLRSGLSGHMNVLRKPSGFSISFKFAALFSVVLAFCSFVLGNLTGSISVERILTARPGQEMFAPARHWSLGSTKDSRVLLMTWPQNDHAATFQNTVTAYLLPPLEKIDASIKCTDGTGCQLISAPTTTGFRSPGQNGKDVLAAAPTPRLARAGAFRECAQLLAALGTVPASFTPDEGHEFADGNVTATTNP